MTLEESYKPLKTIIKPYLLRRVKTDKKIIQDLPEKIEKKTYCSAKEQVDCYKEELDNLAKALKEENEGVQRKGLVLKYLTKTFKQICNHPAQFLVDKDFDAKRSNKFMTMGEIAQNIATKGEKLIVFTQFKELTKPIHDHLKSIFHRPGFILHGGTAVSNEEFVEAFQKSEEQPFFVLSLKAGGSGLNLTRANHVIHFDRWWNSSVENQATDRSFRIGQKSNVMVHKFICRGTLEEKNRPTH